MTTRRSLLIGGAALAASAAIPRIASAQSLPSGSLPGDLITDGGHAFSAYVSQNSLGDKPHYQLLNPSNSGHAIFLDRVIFCSVGSGAYWTVRSHNSQLATEFDGICNVKFGDGTGVGRVFYMKNASILGNVHAGFYVNTEYEWMGRKHPLIQLMPGRGVLCAVHTAAVPTTINFEWREVAISS